MKKSVMIIEIIILLLSLNIIYADVPSENRMKLGEISNVLPVTEMQEYYTKMEPIMLKYFGPPFSDFTLKIDADPTKDEHSTGFSPEKQTLLLAGQARDYVKFKDSNPQFAVRNIENSMKHELSHGMYIYGNDLLSFGAQWPFEGWAKVLEDSMINEIENTTLSLGRYYSYYMDKDTVAGTEGWGGSKHKINHGLVYDMTGSTHFTLMYAASSSLSNPDFYKKMNNKLYDYIKSKNEAHLTLDEYKSIMKPILENVKIDGQPAYDWYFNSPSALMHGSLGPHINVFLRNNDRDFAPSSINAYAFNREIENQRRKETGVSGIDIKIKLKDFNNKEIFEKTLQTDTDGNIQYDIIDLFYELEHGAYFLTGEANIQGMDIKNKYFAFNPPRIYVKKEYIYGILLNENKELVNGKYVSLLTADENFIYKKNGMFILNVPLDKKTAKINFLGLEQEITKGPFPRVFAFTIPNEYLDKAKEKTEEELTAGIVEAEEEEENPTKGWCGDGNCDAGENPCFENCEGKQPGRVDRMGQVEKVGQIGQAEPIEKEYKESFFEKIISGFRKIFGGGKLTREPRKETIIEQCTPREEICRDNQKLRCYPEGDQFEIIGEC